MPLTIESTAERVFSLWVSLFEALSGLCRRKVAYCGFFELSVIHLICLRVLFERSSFSHLPQWCTWVWGLSSFTGLSRYIYLLFNIRFLALTRFLYCLTAITSDFGIGFSDCVYINTSQTVIALSCTFSRYLSLHNISCFSYRCSFCSCCILELFGWHSRS